MCCWNLNYRHTWKMDILYLRAFLLFLYFFICLANKMYPGILISVWFTYGLMMIQWADSRFLRRQCFQMGQSRGRGQPRPPSLGKLCTLQPFTWPSSQDKVRIVCQRVVMPGMLSSVSKCLLFASAEAPRALWTLISEVTGSTSLLLGLMVSLSLIHTCSSSTCPTLYQI